MIKTVGTYLKPLGYPVLWQKRPKIQNKPVISFHFFSEKEELKGNGRGVSDAGSLQIDIFSKSDYTKAVKDVKIALIEKGFLFVEGSDDIESISDTEEIYHKILIFNYVESEVKHGGV